MRKYIFACLYLFLAGASSKACLNDLEYEDFAYTYTKGDYGPLLKVDSFNQANLFNLLHQLEQSKDSMSLQVRNNLATTYMRLADPQTAKEILLKAQQDFPGNYSITANLGTAYELLGKLDSALLWINRAVVINPQSHEGSEWIHVMILRYKIAKEKNPQYLAGGTALMLDFGDKDLPGNPYGLDTRKLQKELAFQLQERLSLIPSPDTLMGMLLYDFANLAILNNKGFQALWYFQAAKDYGFSNAVLEARESRLKEILEADPSANIGAFEANEIEAKSSGMPVYLIAAIIAILAVFGVWMLLRKGKNNR